MDRRDERVVVLAPSAHDGPVTASILEKAGFGCVVVGDVGELCEAVRAGAAVVLVAQEALASATQQFGDVLQRQEPWSDIPVVVFTGRGQGGTHASVAALAGSGNVTLVERPVETITLVSAVRAGLRARHRQYAARGLLAQLQASERRLGLALDVAHAASWEVDLTTGKLSWDDRFLPLLRLQETSDDVQKRWTEFVLPEDRERATAEFRAACEDGAAPYESEFRARRMDGAVRWFASRGVQVREPNGRRRMVGFVQDITERKEAEEELRRAVERHERQVRLFEGVASTTLDFVYLFDLQGRFLYANRRLLDVLGMQRSEVIGKAPRELGYEQSHHDMLLREIARVIETRLPIKGEVPFTAPLTGIFGIYEYIFTPVIGPDGSVEIIAGTTRDVTDRKRAEDALREADRRKSEFLAVLSHELRNPLAPIRNSIYLLERAAASSDTAARAKEVMRRQTEHLTRLVDDLLDITRISVGKIELQRSRVDLREVVRKTADDLHSVFTLAAVELRVDVTLGPVWIDADPTRMAQVLGNLLQNAVKFTPSGGTVTVRVAARDGRAQLSIRDDGAGMDPATIEDMFAPFAQADRTLARASGGLGLGLALVKGLVELHGGTVRARSDGLGCGAEFLVSLPLVKSAVESQDARPRGDGHATPRSILLIEDNVDGAQSLAEILALDGHSVRVARDGRSGIELARELRPDVILCDIGLPDLDGYEVARALRREETLRGARLVALSGYAQPEDRQRARDAGFDTHMAKPPDLQELMAVLEQNGSA